MLIMRRDRSETTNSRTTAGGVSRRQFVASVGATGAAFRLAGCSGTGNGSGEDGPTGSSPRYASC